MELTIQVRATREQKEMLKKRASAFGISVGELCRQTIFSSIPKSKTDLLSIQELAKTRAELGRIGGLLKGWLAGSFQLDPASESTSIRILLKEIESTQVEVLNKVKSLEDAK